MHPNNQRVVEAARKAGLSVEIEHFPEGTRTAEDAAAAVGCEVGAIVKSLVLLADGDPIVVLTSGANRLDFQKVAAALGAGKVRRADADQARAATGYAIGGTAPFGYPAPLPMLFDRDLLEYETVWAAGGTTQTVFAAAPHDLLRATGATLADVAEER